MRALRTLLLLSTLLLGCGPGPDPALAGACSTRKPAEVILGTGEDQFESIGQSIEVQVGPAGQGAGSFHIWFALRCRNMGPNVLAMISVNDVMTGQVLTSGRLREAITLEYNPDEHADEVAGIRAFLPGSGLFGGGGGGSGGESAVDPSDLLGRQVKLSATVDDECKAHVESEVTATVSGYHSP